MYPVLFQWGPVVAHGYGFLIVLGILAGMLLGAHEFRRAGYRAEHALDIVLIGIVTGIAGGKLLFLLTVPFRQVLAEPRRYLTVSTGLVWYGVIGAVVASTWLYARWRRIPVRWTLDVGSGCLMLGHAIGRIGCLTAGCCWGRPTDLPWAIVFRDPRAFAPQGVRLHPTQLYLALHALIAFAFLWFWVRRRKRRDGEMLASFLWTYALGRFFIEMVRADAARGSIGVFSTSQALSLVVFGLGLAWFLILRRGPVARGAR